MPRGNLHAWSHTTRYKRCSLANSYSWFDRHSGPQRVLQILVRIESNTDRQTLNHFHEIATGVFRWQKAEQRSSGAREIFNGSVDITIECIDVNADGLPGP